MIQSKIAQGLGGVKRRKWSRRPLQGASCRMRVSSCRRRICVKGLEPRASAAMSGGGTGSVRRDGEHRKEQGKEWESMRKRKRVPKRRVLLETAKRVISLARESTGVLAGQLFT
ncbi:hypothetical protein EDB85DRAFT_1898993 [Lactarius pseudohatsudake]|nr:hypothetical protein EDB85DRAFT_1898993 [Lactarius pseudohatsudake]